MARDPNDDKPKDQSENADDNFGLPELEYKPLEETGSKAQGDQGSSSGGQPPSGSSSYSDYTPEEPKSKAPLVLGIVIVLVVAIAGYLIYDFVYKPRAEAAAKKERLAKEEAARKSQLALEEQKKREEEERKRAEEALAKANPPVGTIETLSARTKRWYVVVTSDIDDDLLMDYAKKLSQKGISTKVIPPFGGKKFYRLAIADDETYALAQGKADAAKADYGTGVWVLKY